MNDLCFLRYTICISILYFIGIVQGLYAQLPDNSLPVAPPVHAPIRLSGTFGELRPNHFHEGIDIKSSRGTAGDSIFALMDGYISLASVSAGGFGNAVYVCHPNGFTSIYAHLEKFSPGLDSLILAKQYERQQFEVTVEPGKGTFPVRAGSWIGIMGSTGHSFGPHLHMELMNTDNHTRVNPLLLNLKIEDDIAPLLHEVGINHLDYRYQSYHRLSLSPGSGSPGDTLEIDAWRIGLDVTTIDPFNQGINKNGIFSTRVVVNGNLAYQCRFDSITDLQSDLYRSHIDYAHFIRSGKHRQKCYRSSPGDISLHQDESINGIITLYKDQPQRVEVVITDFHGNTVRSEFWVRRKSEVSPVKYPVYDFKAYPEKPFALDTCGIQISWLKHSLFEPLYGRLSIDTAWKKDQWSHAIIIGSTESALKKPIHIQMPTQSTPDSIKRKLIMVNSDENRVNSIPSRYSGGHLIGRSMSFGTFSIVADRQPPEITVLRNSTASARFVLQVYIADDYSGGNLQYSGTIDDKWVLGTYDQRTQRLTYDISMEDWPKGEHLFRLLVKDHVRNESVHEIRFRN